MQTSHRYLHHPTSHQSSFVSHCLQQYQQKLNEQDEFSEQGQEQQILTPQEEILKDEDSLKYYGYENKKSITIKPVRMHKDLIALRKENQEKKKLVENLQKQNIQLKANYQKSMKQNQQVEAFLKDIDFTFKNDKKSQKANQIMLKAKRMLYRDAADCQNIAKKITKSAQANTIQETKMYIQLLETQKQRLQKRIQEKKEENQIKREQQDFNSQNEHKFQNTLQRVELMLNVQMQQTKRHEEIYKIEKGIVSTGLKQKQIVLKKNAIQNCYERLKDLLLKKEGDEYEIVVLQKKRKDKIKLIQQMKQFKNDIIYKKSSIQQLEKQLKQKLKTLDYMSKWTKQLKINLEEKKEHHITQKIQYQNKINALSKEFEEWNKKYKLELSHQHNPILASNSIHMNIRKKSSIHKQVSFGNKDHGLSNKHSISTSTFNKNTKKIKLIRIQEIKKIVKKVKLWLLINEVPLEPFIKEKILMWSQNHQNQGFINNDKRVLTFSRNLIAGSNVKTLKRTAKQYLTLGSRKGQNMDKKYSKGEENGNKGQKPPQITLKQLYNNLRSGLIILKDIPDSEIMKLARYVVQDHDTQTVPIGSVQNNIKTKQGWVQNVSISKDLALTILKTLFQNQLKGKREVEQIKIKLRQFLVKFYDPLRYDLLKMLLSMGGLKSLQAQKQEEKSQRLIKRGQSIQSSQLQTFQSETTQNMSNMRRNQQLQLQLQLDEDIFLRNLKKHVVEQFYVVRFKEVLDLMIFQEFGQSDKPRLGMLDKVCELVIGKRLIKGETGRDYNFERIVEVDQNELVAKEKEVQTNQMIKFGIEADVRVEMEADVKDEKSYLLVPQIKKEASNLEMHFNEQEDDMNPKQGKGKKKQRKVKSWLDELMSDGEDNQVQQNQSNDSKEDY